MRILVTGGAGYIGSHTCVELACVGHDIVVYDNFSNSSPDALHRIERLIGRQIPLVTGDIRDEALLRQTLSTHGCESVIHFAGWKSVGASAQQPLEYYDNNVGGTLSLLRAMQTIGTRRLVFSSSATVYGEPQHLPLTEDHPRCATNPYGHTKLMIEQMLFDLHRAAPDWNITILRYFNPVGAHASGLIGEDPRGTPNNLVPYIAQVAVGRRDALSIWGRDYPTRDGTGVRDYIHVVDLARGHLAALKNLHHAGCLAINLGTGAGHSVLEVVNAFERVSHRSVPVRFADRRPGDVAACYANADLAKRLLDWRPEHDLERMCEDHWRWQSANPAGYG